jgi:hypothetical protein
MPEKSPAPERLTAQCQLRKGDQFSSGTATVDHERLSFHGYFQYDLPLAELRSVTVQRDILKLETADGYLTLKLPKRAHAWAEFLRSARSASR